MVPYTVYVVFRSFHQLLPKKKPQVSYFIMSDQTSPSSSPTDKFQPTWKLPEGIEDDLTMGKFLVGHFGLTSANGERLPCLAVFML